MAEERSLPRVFTIPGGVPFLDTLAEALLAGRLVDFDRDDPLALSAVTVLLPTRRAVRAFREALVRHLDGAAAILPMLRTIGDVDEEAHLLAPSAEPAGQRLALPAAVTPLKRHLTLTQLVLAWGRSVRHALLALSPDEPLLVPASAADAARLAGDLARLLDDIETAGIPWGRLDGLVPEDHARYYQITLEFLRIVAEQWPAILAEMGRVDPAVRRDTLIRASAARLAGPVVAAGSTGSIPATAYLLEEIARHPQGAVVLPGLDQDLDDATWAAIGDNDNAPPSTFGHPQFGLKQLIGHIGVLRQDVEPLAGPDDALAARRRLVAEALRPAETTDRWADTANADADDALDGVALMVARNEQEEATAIALALREAVETPGARAALITPDRTIARRVAAELGRWGLDIDDSAGMPLDRTEEGIFARLLAEAALSEAEPVRLLALAKHPLAAFGMSRPQCRHAARMLEIALFRGHRVAGGVTALAAALATRKAEIAEGTRHVPRARRRMSEDDWALAGQLAGTLTATLAPMEAVLHAGGEISAAGMTALLAAALHRAATDERGSDALAGDKPARRMLHDILDGLADAGGLTLPPADYPYFLAALMGEVNVPRPPAGDPRIHIWGALEARLQSVDLAILAGLDEGVWPAETRTDPFLSRSMRSAVGLTPPERRLGLAAHDFAEGMAMAHVIVARAEKRGGTPTVESRWLQRLRALIGGQASAVLTARGARLVAIARALDRPTGAIAPVQPPEPRPPVAARPRRLSITEIETLIRDPYAVYAKHVLKLEPLDALGLAPDAALRGSIIHAALARFTQGWAGAYGAAAEARLLALGAECLSEIEDFPDVHAVWTIRLAAIARWFIGWEAVRDAAVAKRHAEISGTLEIPAPAGAFTLTGRADRIDEMTDATLAIYDFKSGTPQTERTVFAGLTPQMTLEAAVAHAGGFADIPAGASIGDLAWLSVGQVGRNDPYVSAVRRGETADELAGRAGAELQKLVEAFDDPKTPYLSRARPMMANARYGGDYDHLARVREWSLVGNGEDGE